MDRQFIKPAPIMCRVGLDKEGRPVEFEYHMDGYFTEYVWKYPKWNEEESWGEAQIRIGDALEAAKVGEPVGFSLEDWEMLREANRAAKIEGQYAHRVRRHQRTVSGASRPPEAKALPVANGAKTADEASC